MTAYPINYEYDRHAGSMHDGFAETAEKAREVSSMFLTLSNGKPTDAGAHHLSTVEAGMIGTKSDIEGWWSDEIEAGWVTPQQVWGGWIAQVEYWTTA